MKKLRLEDIPIDQLREYPKSTSIGFISSKEIWCGKEKWFSWNRGECSILSNLYPCDIEYDGMKFHSVEQMFHFYSFTQNPAAQRAIMIAADGKKVKEAVKEFEEDSDLRQKHWKLLQTCLELKYQVCPEFRECLKRTTGLNIVEVNTWWDVEYGTIDGAKLKNGEFKGKDVSDYYIGLNGTGRCIMQIRENHKIIENE